MQVQAGGIGASQAHNRRVHGDRRLSVSKSHRVFLSSLNTV